MSRFACVPVVLVLLMLIGAALRLRELSTVPSWTDELREILLALDIVSGVALPLVDVRGYLGAFWNYLLAAFFLVFGMNAFLPRLVAALCGVLTILATYLLGRTVGGPAVGIFAAGLLTVSGPHVLVNSHIAFSNSITPLFTTLGTWLVLQARSAGGGPLLVLAGVVWGLAVQTHITAIAMVIAVACYVCLCRQAWLRQRWAWFAVIAFLVAYGNVLLSLVVDRDMFEDADRTAALSGGTGLDLVQSYQRGESPRPREYLSNASRIAINFVRLLSGAVDIRSTAADYLRDPVAIALLLMLLLGIVRIIRQRSPLPVMAIVCLGMLLWMVNSKYDVVPNGRYVMPAVPLALVLAGHGLVGLVQRLSPRGWLPLAVVGALVIPVGGAYLVRLDTRLRDMQVSREASRSLQGVVDRVNGTTGVAERVFIDRELEKLWLDGGGTYRKALQYLFRVSGVPTTDLIQRSGDYRIAVDPCRTSRAVLERLRVGDGQAAEGLIPAGAVQPGEFVWVVRVARFGEESSSIDQSIQYRTPIATGRAEDVCGRKRWT